MHVVALAVKVRLMVDNSLRITISSLESRQPHTYGRSIHNLANFSTTQTLSSQRCPQGSLKINSISFLNHPN